MSPKKWKAGDRLHFKPVNGYREVAAAFTLPFSPAHWGPDWWREAFRSKDEVGARPLTDPVETYRQTVLTRRVPDGRVSEAATKFPVFLSRSSSSSSSSSSSLSSPEMVVEQDIVMLYSSACILWGYNVGHSQINMEWRLRAGIDLLQTTHTCTDHGCHAYSATVWCVGHTRRRTWMRRVRRMQYWQESWGRSGSGKSLLAWWKFSRRDCWT